MGQHWSVNTVSNCVNIWDYCLEPGTLFCTILSEGTFHLIHFNYLALTGILPLSSLLIPTSSKPRFWVYGLLPTHTRRTSASSCKKCVFHALSTISFKCLFLYLFCFPVFHTGNSHPDFVSLSYSRRNFGLELEFDPLYNLF